MRQRHALQELLQEKLPLRHFRRGAGVGAVLLGIVIRLGNPDVWDVIWGGEKPMDLSYFNAVLKAPHFPVQPVALRQLHQLLLLRLRFGRRADVVARHRADDGVQPDHSDVV